VIRRVALLIVGAVAFWGLASQLAIWMGAGEFTRAYSATAMLVCLVPAVATLILAEWVSAGKSENLALASLGGGLFRMLVAGAAAILLPVRVEFFRQQDGWLIWVVVCYLAVLALEVGVIVTGRQKPTA